MPASAIASNVFAQLLLKLKTTIKTNNIQLLHNINFPEDIIEPQFKMLFDLEMI